MKISSWVKIIQAIITIGTQIIRALRLLDNDNAAAEDSYNQGVQEAIAAGRFGRGVRDAGTGKWRQKIQAVGIARWPQGVAAAGDDFQKGFAPYREALERIDLPPRMPRGHPDNINRVAIIATTLHELRTRMA